MNRKERYYGKMKCYTGWTLLALAVILLGIVFFSGEQIPVQKQISCVEVNTKTPIEVTVSGTYFQYPFRDDRFVGTIKIPGWRECTREYVFENDKKSFFVDECGQPFGLIQQSDVFTELSVMEDSYSIISEQAPDASQSNQTQEGTYSFYGENEYFSLSNGSIVVSGEMETFDGGVLKAIDPELFSDVKSFSASFYTIKSNGKQDDFVTHKIYSSDGTPVSFGGSLGRSSSNSPDLIRKIEQGGLWLEVQTVDTADKETVYQLELTVTEVHN